MKEIYVCFECGSRDIHIDVWVNPNTGEKFDDGPGAMDGKCFCNGCQEHRDMDVLIQPEQPE